MFTISSESSLSPTYKVKEETGYGPMVCRIEDMSWDSQVAEEYHCVYLFTKTTSPMHNVHVSITGDITPSDMERMHNQILEHLDNGMPLYRAVRMVIWDTGQDFDVKTSPAPSNGIKDLYISCTQVKKA